ncbi:MAG: RHS repeat-associated core domain-containing protein, partial [Bacteroidetes bacterium]|nr:RHS repeat-associated core domain-containing protein [Bacteroidota bacterium]
MLQFFAHEEGRVVNDGTGILMYQYNLTDHLGNVRLTYEDTDSSGTITTATEVVQANDPYPFGMNMAGLTYPVGSPKNSYLYNGKELQDELGLNLYDYGARFYDPVIGRWNGVDALAEKYLPISPYVYVADNPLIFIDPSGRDIFIVIGGQKLNYTQLSNTPSASVV